MNKAIVPDVYGVLNEPEALKRRFHFDIEMIVKPEYAMATGGINAEAVLNIPSDKAWTIYEFKVNEHALSKSYTTDFPGLMVKMCDRYEVLQLHNTVMRATRNKSIQRFTVKIASAMSRLPARQVNPVFSEPTIYEDDNESIIAALLKPTVSAISAEAFELERGDICECATTKDIAFVYLSRDQCRVVEMINATRGIGESHCIWMTLNEIMGKYQTCDFKVIRGLPCDDFIQKRTVVCGAWTPLNRILRCCIPRVVICESLRDQAYSAWAAAKLWKVLKVVEDSATWCSAKALEYYNLMFKCVDSLGLSSKFYSCCKATKVAAQSIVSGWEPIKLSGFDFMYPIRILTYIATLFTAGSVVYKIIDYLYSLISGGGVPTPHNISRHALDWPNGLPEPCDIPTENSMIVLGDGTRIIGKVIPKYVYGQHGAAVSGDPATAKYLNRPVPVPRSFHGAAVSGDPATSKYLNRPVPVPRAFHAKIKVDHPLIVDSDGTLTSPTVHGIWSQDVSREIMSSDPTAESICSSVHNRNIVGLQAGCSVSAGMMSGIGVFDKVICTARHLFQQGGFMCPKDSMDGYLFLTIHRQGMDAWKSKNFFIEYCDDADLCFVYVTDLPYSFTDISKNFHSVNDVLSMNWNHMDGVILSRYDGHTGFHTCTQIVTAIGKGYSVNFPAQDAIPAERYDDMYRYGCRTYPGLCGSLIVVFDRKVARKFIGIHIAQASVEVKGFCIPVYLEDLETIKRIMTEKIGRLTLVEAPHLHPLGAIGTRDTMSLNSTEKFMLLGRLDRDLVPRAPTHSKIIPSLLADARVPTTMIADLRVKTVEIETFVGLSFPQTDNVEKQAGGVWRTWQQYVVNDVTSELCDLYNGFETQFKRMWRPISDDANINGMEYFAKLTKNTSPGLPWNAINSIEGVTKKTGKKNFVVTFEEDAFFTEGFQQLVGKLEKKCETHVPAVIATIFCKDERRPPHKACSPRTISTLPVEFLVLMRRYFATFVALVQEQHNVNEVKIGINPLSDEWQLLHTQLCEVGGGKNLFGFDYSAYDKQLPRMLTNAALEVILSWYETQFSKDIIHNTFDEPDRIFNLDDIEALKIEFERTQVIRRNLWHAITECNYANGDIVFHTPYGNPSGNPLTTQMNSIVNQYLCRLAYYEIVPAECGPFENNVRIAVFGDDCVVSVSDEVAPYYNFLTVKTNMSIHNVKITWPSKKLEDEMEFCGDFINLSFLKRSFRRQEDGYIVGPIEKATIEETPLWIHKDLSIEEATIDNYVTSLREAFFHGRSYYEEFVNMFVGVARANNLKLPRHSYERMKAEMMKPWRTLANSPSRNYNNFNWEYPDC